MAWKHAAYSAGYCWALMVILVAALRGLGM
jgi:predicted metal-binding membrane protein